MAAALSISSVPALMLLYLQRHSSLSTHRPSCSSMSPGHPQVELHPGESTHSVSPYRSEQERGQGFPQGHCSCPPPQSTDEDRNISRQESGIVSDVHMTVESADLSRRWCYHDSHGSVDSLRGRTDRRTAPEDCYTPSVWQTHRHTRHSLTTSSRSPMSRGLHTHTEREIRNI